MTQMSLVFRPAARASDPTPSHLADRAMTTSGARQTQAAHVLRLVRWWPDATAGELAAHSAREDRAPLDSVAITRRLADLEHAGAIRRTGTRACSVRGRQMTTWRAREGNGGV